MNSSIYSKDWDVQNARDIADKKVLSADVVIIGSGAGGGYSADILSKKGLKVILIEEGPYRNSKHFNMIEREAFPDLYQEATARKTKDKSISILQGKSVGGSTTVNWTSSFRTPKQTRDYWKQEFGLEGFDDQSMQPWFESVEQRLSMEPWALPANENNQILARGMQKLGWSSRVIPRNVKNCGNLGYCGMGCPIDAKQSMLVTTIPAALNNGATLISRARAEKLVFKGDAIESVIVKPMSKTGKTYNNHSFKIRAKHFVLAAGAIGSPSILMKSDAPDPNNLLGRRTFLHPVTVSSAFMPEAVNGYSGAPQSIYSDEFLWRDGTSGEMGYKFEVPPLHPLLVSVFVPGHGIAHRKMMEQFANMHSIISLFRDGFNADSQGGTVEIGDQGQPVLDYPLNDYFWRGARDSLLKMAEIQFAAGSKQVMPMHSDAGIYTGWSQAKKAINELSMEKLKLTVFSAHVMGGCGMGSSDKNSVVDPHGRHHQISNLTINDGSILPTSLGVNPQLTVYSIALRNATRLASEFTA